MEKELDFNTTAEIAIPKTLVEQVIGQDRAVEIVKRAARQKRHLLLIGPPGIGKSMLAQAMSELLPIEELEDILAYPNPVMENEPIVKSIRTYPDWDYLKKNPHFIRYYTAQELNVIRIFSENKDYSGMVDKLGDGLGRRMVFNNTKQFKDEPKKIPRSALLLLFAIIGLAILFAPIENDLKWLAVALLFGIGVFYMLSGIADSFNRMPMQGEIKPKLVVDNTRKKKAPFIDGTGAKAGALLGDVKHDPLQSGGLGTPAHLRVEAGAIHKANKGILFIDEMASLKINWQQELLTAMQEKKYSITGQSELSSGALVKTTPAGSDFVLVAAGNMNDLKMIHPALRSRIRGSGYEVYMKDDMEDTKENREKIARLVAQEIAKDSKIPHFTKTAVLEIIGEAKRIAGKKNRLTLRLRELGGLIRASGDLAVERNSKFVEKEHVEEARKYYKIIESQAADVVLERKKEYQVFKSTGFEIGRVNGLAVLGESAKGIVLPIVADVTPASSEVEGKTIATGKLGKIAKEAVNNVSALVKKTIKKDLTKKDTHIQFIQTYEGVEGDSASIAVAVAVLSAMEQIPIDQGVAVTGSIDIRGSVLPVGGVSSKIEAAIETGIKKIIVPKKNLQDISISTEKLKGIEIIGVETIEEALEHLLKETREKRKLLKLFSA